MNDVLVSRCSCFLSFFRQVGLVRADHVLQAECAALQQSARSRDLAMDKVEMENADLLANVADIKSILADVQANVCAFGWSHGGIH